MLYLVAIFDRSGRYVITGSDDRLVKIWSMETALCLASCRGHEVSYDCLHNMGNLLSLSLSCSIICFFLYYLLFDLLFLLYESKGDITDLAVSSNNTLVASASNDFVIRVVCILYFVILFSLLLFLFIKNSYFSCSGVCQMDIPFQYCKAILEL